MCVRVLPVAWVHGCVLHVYNSSEFIRILHVQCKVESSRREARDAHNGRHTEKEQGTNLMSCVVKVGSYW